jgi:hypothetical protein
MGMFDTVHVPCPKCGERRDFQTKSGSCCLAHYELDAAPLDVMTDVNRHAPQHCRKCGVDFVVGMKDFKFVPMTKDDAIASSEGLTNRDALAAFVYQGVRSGVMEAARPFGMSGPLNEIATNLAQDAVKALQQVPVEIVDKQYDAYRLEMERLQERQRQHTEELTKSLGKPPATEGRKD